MSTPNCKSISRTGAERKISDPPPFPSRFIEELYQKVWGRRALSKVSKSEQLIGLRTRHKLKQHLRFWEHFIFYSFWLLIVKHVLALQTSNLTIRTVTAIFANANPWLRIQVGRMVAKNQFLHGIKIWSYCQWSQGLTWNLTMLKGFCD